MKTSNKLLLAAACGMVLILGLYDYDLQTEFRKGNYANPYRHFIALPYHHFSAIRLNAGCAVNMMLVRGPFSIMADPEATPVLHMSQQGDTLVIDAHFPDEYQNIRSTYNLFISCPSVSAVYVDTYYGLAKTIFTDTVASEDFKWKPSVISGFNLDSLHIYADHAGNIECRNDTIAVFKAVIGPSKGSASNLMMGFNNQIYQSQVTVLNKSRLWLRNSVQTPITYQLSDSSRLILDGAVNNKIKF